MSHMPATISTDTDAAQGSLPISNPTPSLSLIERGPYLWDVHVDGRRERWELDHAYGKFPVGVQEHFVYRGQEYILQQAWYSILVVALEERTTEAQAAETRALAGV